MFYVIIEWDILSLSSVIKYVIMFLSICHFFIFVHGTLLFPFYLFHFCHYQLMNVSYFLNISLDGSIRTQELTLGWWYEGIDRVVIVLFAMVVILPLSLKRNIRDLRWSSTISVNPSGLKAA